MAGNRSFFLGKNRFFKIAQITDLHLGSFRNSGPEQKTLALIEEIAQKEKPDIFVCTGDLSSGFDCENCFRVFSRFMDERKLYWTFTYGNHDRDYGPPARVIEKILLDSERCIFDRGPDDISGQSNYAVRIYGKNNRLCFVIWMLDSGVFAQFRGKRVRAYIDSSQTDWFADEKERICTEPDAKVSSLFFFHIPLPEFKEALERGAAVGGCGEGIGCSEVNSGAFAAMKEIGNTLGVFVGHDHKNDYIAQWHGVKLCYGRVTGYSDYRRGAHPSPDRIFPRGARIIVLDQENADSFDTYIRLDGGEIIRQNTKTVFMP